MLKLLFSKSNPEKGTDSCPPITGSINSGKFKPIFIADKKKACWDGEWGTQHDLQPSLRKSA